MNLHNGGYPMRDDHKDPDTVPIWTDEHLGVLLNGIVMNLRRGIRDLEQLCSEGLTLDEMEFSDLENLKEIAGTLHARATRLMRNNIPSLVDRRFPIKCIYEHGLSEEDTTGYYVGRNGVTSIVPYIEYGEAWLAVYRDKSVLARVPAKAVIITYQEAVDARES